MDVESTSRIVGQPRRAADHSVSMCGKRFRRPFTVLRWLSTARTAVRVAQRGGSGRPDPGAYRQATGEAAR